MFNEQYDDHLKDMDDEEFARSLSQASYEATEITNLKATVERLTAALDVFFKVVVVDEQEYKPCLDLCAGCEELTIARGWECFYKPLTTECKYPDEIRDTARR